MLDGAPIEDPFSILSASIEHPLGSGGGLVNVRIRCGRNGQGESGGSDLSGKEERTKKSPPGWMVIGEMRDKR